jgi:hypothetical protein
MNLGRFEGKFGEVLRENCVKFCIKFDGNLIQKAEKCAIEKLKGISSKN